MGGAAAQGSDELEQAQWALVVQLAAQFQAYCRDLHRLAVDELMKATASETPELEAVIRRNLSAHELARGNANANRIANDFTRIGLGGLWQLAETENPGSAAWITTLSKVLDLRNGITHGDHNKIVAHLPANTDLFAVALSWRRDIDALVDVLDRVVAVWLENFLGMMRPW